MALAEDAAVDVGHSPIHDEDTKSYKNESKLRQCYLWNGQGNIGVAIVNRILPEILVFRGNKTVGGVSSGSIYDISKRGGFGTELQLFA